MDFVELRHSKLCTGFFFKKPIFIGLNLTMLFIVIYILILFTIYLVKKNEFIGYILARGMLKLCFIIGIMLSIQTVFQLVNKIEIPVPALITKVLIFVVLAVFARYIERNLKGNFIYSNSDF